MRTALHALIATCFIAFSFAQSERIVDPITPEDAARIKAILGETSFTQNEGRNLLRASELIAHKINRQQYLELRSILIGLSVTNRPLAVKIMKSVLIDADVVDGKIELNKVFDTSLEFNMALIFMLTAKNNKLVVSDVEKSDFKALSKAVSSSSSDPEHVIPFMVDLVMLVSE